MPLVRTSLKLTLSSKRKNRKMNGAFLKMLSETLGETNERRLTSSSVWDMVPDLQIEINTIFVDKADDGEPWVGALVTLRGTIADNNQLLELPEFWLFQISGGKLAECRYLVDRAKLSG